MKKVITLILALLMAFSLVACGEKAPVDDGAAPGDAGGEVVVMKFAGTAVADPNDGEYDAMLKFEELVEKYSNGTIDVQLYPANQLGTSMEFTEGVTLGTVECAVTGFDGIAVVNPSMNAFSMPYQYDNNEQMRAVLEGDTACRAACDEELAKTNMKMVGIMYRPFRVVVNSKQAVTDPESMKGITLRVPDTACMHSTMNAMGAMTSSIAWGETYSAIANGVVDGCEGSITNMISTNIYEVVDYISETNHVSSAIPIIVAKGWFDGLTQEQQDAIVKAGWETTDYRYGTVTAETEAAWKICEDAGIEVLYMDEIDAAAFKEATKDVYKDYVAQGFFTEEFYLATLPQ